MSNSLPNPYGNSAPITPAPEVNPYTLGTGADLPEIDETKIERAIAKLRAQQSFPLAFAAGLAAALVSGALWAGITFATMFQIGYMAVGVGFLVGYAVRHTGKGLSKVYGYLGGGFAFLGCVLGNFFSTCAFAAHDQKQPIIDFVVKACTHPDLAIVIMIASFQPMDLLFYGIAIYEAYHYSFRELTEDEALAAMDEV